MNILERIGLVKAPPAPPAPVERVSPPARIRPPEGRPSYDLALQTFSQLAQIRQTQNLTIFGQLRELIPILDRGIRLRTALIGCPKIEAKNPETAADIEDWLKNLHVNHLQTGFSLFLTTWIDHMFLYGRSHAEMLLTARGDDIWGIQQLSTPTIYMRPREDHVSVDIVQNQPGNLFKVLDPKVMLTALHGVEGDDPYGKSLYRSCPFIAEIYTAMVRSLGGTWSRFGQPDYHIDLEFPPGFGDPHGDQSQAFASGVAGQFNQAMLAKANGQNLPFISSHGSGGACTVSIIGAAGETLEFSTPAGDLMDQMVSAVGVPSWLLGIHRGSTERLSTNEASLLTETVERDQAALEAEIRYLISLRQSLRGGDQEFSICWEGVSLLDKKEQAAADLAEAQAREKQWSNATALWRAKFVTGYDVARDFVAGYDDLDDDEIDAARAAAGLPPLSEVEPPAAPTPVGPFGGGAGNQEHPASPALGVRSLTYADGFQVRNGNGRH